MISEAKNVQLWKTYFLDGQPVQVFLTLPSETENHLPAKLSLKKCWENNFGCQRADTSALSKWCILFFSIIFAREELVIMVLEHTGATDDRLEEEKLKAIRKQLFSNHPLTLSSHCVAYLSIFPYTLPSLIFPLFVPSILTHVSQCARYETLQTSALWLIKLPGKRTATALI